jgi:hypothetical protein
VAGDEAAGAGAQGGNEWMNTSMNCACCVHVNTSACPSSPSSCCSCAVLALFSQGRGV